MAAANPHPNLGGRHEVHPAPGKEQYGGVLAGVQAKPYGWAYGQP
jgi:hypothetical protein